MKSRYLLLLFLIMFFVEAKSSECYGDYTFDLDLEKNIANGFSDEDAGLSISENGADIELYDFSAKSPLDREQLSRIGSIINNDMKLYVSKRSSLVDLIFIDKNDENELIRISILPGRKVVYVEKMKCRQEKE